MKFVDELKVSLKSGKGGAGSVSFRRERLVPRGGPDGGDGGKGGSIIFRVNSRLRSLLDLSHQKRYWAKNGDPGAGENCSGKDGEDLVIEVPIGTLIKDEIGNLIRDLSTPEEEFIILKGGRGGKGNTFFKNSVNQAPTHAQPGEDGEEMMVHLELKLIADIGLLGFPNVGKSTLISRVSAAKPKIADYPFTTLAPNLGVVKPADGTSFVIADIPGLIPGAHKGVGLGIRFLKHIERTSGFIHILDGSGMSGRDPIEDLRAINEELAAYDDKVEHDGLPLSKRPQIVVVNKVDVLGRDNLERLKIEFRKHDINVLPISAVTGIGLEELINRCRSMLGNG